jgi:hypothetical protein
MVWPLYFPDWAMVWPLCFPDWAFVWLLCFPDWAIPSFRLKSAYNLLLG